MSKPDLQQLEQKLGSLIQAYQHLEKENRELKADRSSWLSEREKLVQQNQLARDKVQDMIERLKKMESDIE